jgi:outer membrane protein assembly factor BamB
MSSPRRRPRRPLVWAVVVLVCAGAAAGAYAILKSRTGDIRHPNAEFQGEKPKSAPAVQRSAFLWPNLGYTKDRRGYFPAPSILRPPFRTRWRLRGRVLLELPPVIYNGFIYQMNNSGFLRKIDKETGRVRWKRRYGTLAAATPAVGDGGVYVTILQRAPDLRKGAVVSVDARTGVTRWRRDLPSRTESSPLLDHGHVYFGSEDGTVYSLRASNGSVRWKYRAAGAVKGGPALSNGVLYFGDYGGEVHAVRQDTGRRVWSTGTTGAALGFSSGQFYATPSVAFGRVYIGNTDHRMYSFVARTGKLAWASETGSYVYAPSPVADVRGLGPTVYTGSYDGTFYAFNARTGGVRWRRGIGNPISGGATIIGNIVYFASLEDNATRGLDIRTGRTIFKFPDGRFHPAISDGTRLYLDGYRDLYALDPARPAAPKPVAKP